MHVMKKYITRMVNWSFYGKLSRKITTVFLLFVITSITLSYSLFQYNATSYTLSNINRSTKQTLVSISQNITDMIRIANSNYALLLKTDIEALTSNNLDSEKLRFYDTYLFTIVDTYEQINSIYVTDFSKHIYGIDKTGIKSLCIDSIDMAPWYQNAINAQGGYLLCYNAGNIFKNDYSSDFISMIRVVNNLETQKPMGFVILNISCDSISSMFQTVFPSTHANVSLYTEENILTTSTGKQIDTNTRNTILSKINKEQPYYSFTDKNNLVAGLYIEDLDYKLVANLPINYKTDFSNPLFGNGALVLLINILLMLLCSVLLSKSIADPIHNLIHSMRGVKHEDFSPVKVLHPNSELGMLEENYNRMIQEIQSLLDRLIKEQNVKRRIELRVLQEQIKPHFLYNTLDAIGCMALTDDPMAVYGAIETLGSFYRQSLSKGEPIITLEKEIQIVKDYVALLTLRYESLFDITYNIDATLLALQVPKLILQPLIENCIYHGIKPLGEKGYIHIQIYYQESFVSICITDNGIGIDELTIKTLSYLSPKLDKSLGIGLVGTLERLTIFYGELFHYKIESKRNKGTTITLCIPYKKIQLEKKEI